MCLYLDHCSMTSGPQLPSIESKKKIIWVTFCMISLLKNTLYVLIHMMGKNLIMFIDVVDYANGRHIQDRCHIGLAVCSLITFTRF